MMILAKRLDRLKQEMQFKFDVDELQSFACDFASSLSGPHVVTLFGDLGAGKTTFVKSAIHSFVGLKDVEVPSPTFTLVNIYDSIRGEIWHADLYRLKNASEIEELGLLEALHRHICFVEWPEIMLEALPNRNRTDIFINILDDRYRELKVHRYS